MSNAQYQSDGDYDVPRVILHELVYRAVMADRVSPQTSIHAAARQLDQAGAIPEQAREVLVEAYPQIFRPAHEMAANQKESSYE